MKILRKLGVGLLVAGTVMLPAPPAQTAGPGADRAAQVVPIVVVHDELPAGSGPRGHRLAPDGLQIHRPGRPPLPLEAALTALRATHLSGLYRVPDGYVVSAARRPVYAPRPRSGALFVSDGGAVRWIRPPGYVPNRAGRVCRSGCPLVGADAVSTDGRVVVTARPGLTGRTWRTFVTGRRISDGRVTFHHSLPGRGTAMGATRRHLWLDTGETVRLDLRTGRRSTLPSLPTRPCPTSWSRDATFPTIRAISPSSTQVAVPGGVVRTDGRPGPGRWRVRRCETPTQWSYDGRRVLTVDRVRTYDQLGYPAPQLIRIRDARTGKVAAAFRGYFRSIPQWESRTVFAVNLASSWSLDHEEGWFPVGGGWVRCDTVARSCETVRGADPWQWWWGLS